MQVGVAPVVSADTARGACRNAFASLGSSALPGILVVERSTTLNHLLKRTLAAAGLVARSELASYVETVDHLRRSADLDQHYSLLLIGAPARMTRDFASLLDYLRSDAGARLPVVLMTHELLAELNDFARSRANLNVMLWSSFNRLPGVVREDLHEEDDAAVPAAPTTVPANGIQILFVDDSQSVRLAYQHLLERNGYQVAVAGSIAEAAQMAAQAHYDLVIIDYYLPDGNGDELCRRLAARSGAPALAIITGTYREDVIKRCLEAGATECMFKNEAKELFLARVRTLSRQIQMQKSVEAERQRLDGILGSVGDGVFGVDGHGVVTFINPTGVRLLGADSESAIVGHKAHATIHYARADGHALDEADCVLSHAYARGESLSAHETVFYRADGVGMPVECTVLPLAIQQRREGSVVVFRDISERKSAERLRWEVSHDRLTGLANARHFHELLTAELQRRREHGGYSALLYIDIDRYNYVVDMAGTQNAEQLLADIASLIGKHLRDGDALGRIEGDRFALLLSGVQLENLFPVADGFRELLHQCRYQTQEQPRYASASVGVAVISKDTPSGEYALEHARLACKTAKQRGRDQTEVYVGEFDARIAREIEAGWTERLRNALEQERFVFLAQPIVPIAALPESEDAIVQRQGWRINGAGEREHEYLFEVLIRMVGNDGQLISPSVFLPLAERVGMLTKIDLWVINRLLRYLQNLKDLKAPIAFNVNVSNMTVADPESLGLIEAAIKASGVPAHQLIFEITETSELTSLHVARRFIAELKKLGCRFALDDFGTGFSSFTHLRHLPVDFVKIEGSVVEGMAGSELDRQMVSSITQLAQSLKLRVIGEHVDSFATLAALRAAGAEYAQGNYLGEPRPLRALDFNLLFPALASPEPDTAAV
jgi:diguanylate cyclase (GGDEF)-like protein/PAS domain S-box-containing protein